MAKYVGKIFKANNKDLGLRQSDSHYVYVDWYNPFTKKFRCRTLTSLEKRKTFLENDKRDELGTTAIKRVSNDTFYLFDKSKYSDLRDGKIIPIPIGKTKGFGFWVGYMKTCYLTKKQLKSNEKSIQMFIDKKKKP